MLCDHFDHVMLLEWLDYVIMIIMNV